jgi:hypothetical protein
MLQNYRRRYMLGVFTVEYRVGRGWFYGGPFDKPADYKGPYSNPTSVSLMIARSLRKEVERRDEPHNIDV